MTLTTNQLFGLAACVLGLTFVALVIAWAVAESVIASWAKAFEMQTALLRMRMEGPLDWRDGFHPDAFKNL